MLGSGASEELSDRFCRGEDEHGMHHLGQVSIAADERTRLSGGGERHKVVVIRVTARPRRIDRIGQTVAVSANLGHENIRLVGRAITPEPGTVKHRGQFVEEPRRDDDLYPDVADSLPKDRRVAKRRDEGGDEDGRVDDDPGHLRGTPVGLRPLLPHRLQLFVGESESLIFSQGVTGIP